MTKAELVEMMAKDANISKVAASTALGLFHDKCNKSSEKKGW